MFVPVVTSQDSEKEEARIEREGDGGAKGEGKEVEEDKEEEKMMIAAREGTEGLYKGGKGKEDRKKRKAG